MSNLFKTTRTSNGITTEQSNVATDITSLGGRVTDATGLVILSNDEHVFLPDTLKDRQAIIDATISLCDATSSLCDALVSEPIGTVPTTASPVTPVKLADGYKTGINQVKSTLGQIKSNLQQIKDNLE